MRVFPFFLKVFLILWIPIAPFGVYFGPTFFLFWTFTAALIGGIVSKSTVGVLQDFIDYVDSGNALEHPEQMNIRKSFLYGPVIRRFKEIQKTLGFEMAKTKGEQALLHAVLASISDGVIAIDRRRNVLFVNSAARQLCEITKENIEGKSIEEVVPIPAIQEISRSSLFFDRPMQKTFSVYDANEEKQFSMQTEPFGSGDTSGVVFTVHDHSRAHREERDRRAFIMNASHELRTPLMAIQGYMDSLVDPSLPLELREKFLRKTSENVDRLSDVSTKLLDLAQNDAPDQDRSSQGALNVTGLLIETLENYRPLILAKGLSLKHSIPKSDFFVKSDRESMKTIFENLLDNAIKYSKSEGSIEVSLESEAKQVYVRVTDTGIGISEDDQKKVFERFFRADKARTTQGSGLGLSIVKSLVESLKGGINVSSELNRGSAFTVTLPKSSS